LKTLLAFFRALMVLLFTLYALKKRKLSFFTFYFTSCFPVPGREMSPRHARDREKDLRATASFIRKIKGLAAWKRRRQQQPVRTAFFNTAIFLQVRT
jgi:hypothetical protein